MIMKLIKKILFIVGGILLIQILIALIFGFTLMFQWGFMEGLLADFGMELLVLILIVFLVKFFQMKKKK